MIKQLIADLSHDKITLSKALTRTKLISSKVKNESLSTWLTKELGGYEYGDPLLPDFRKLRCVTYLKVELPFGKTHTFALSFEDENDKKFLDSVQFHRALAPIPILESNIETLTTQKGRIPLLPEQVILLAKPYQESINGQGGVVRSGYWEIGKVQLINVIEQTKQKLLDTLLELNKEFPTLLDEFVMTKENQDKVQNIINNHIYGDNNRTNIAAGNNVQQTITTSDISDEDEKMLKSRGVTQEQIEELRSILKTDKGDKPTLVGKAMKWLGSVSAAIAGRGLYEHIPQITDFVHKLTINA